MVGFDGRHEASDVVDDEWRRQRQEFVDPFRQLASVELELHVPPVRSQCARQRPAWRSTARRRPAACGTERRARRDRQPLEFVVGHVVVDHDHGACRGTERCDRLELEPVVETVRGRLHDHDAVETELRLHPGVVGEGRIRGLEHCGRADRVAVVVDVDVGVADAAQRRPSRRPPRSKPATRRPG